LKKLLITLLKIGVSLAIVAYLLEKAKGDRAFSELAGQPKNWGLLALATLVFGASVVLTHVRWYYLVRSLDLPFRFRDALRLGFLGYLFNLAPTGIVGGDLLKAVLLVKHLRGQRAKAMASVVADRAIGLYILFVVASAAILLTGVWRRDSQIYGLCMVTIAVTLFGALGLAALFTPGITGGRLTSQLGRTGQVGLMLQRLIIALRMYQQNLPMLLATTLMSVGVQVLIVFGIYLTACGLYDRVAPLGVQFVCVPLSGSTGVLPLPIGPFEWALDSLYARFGMPLHQGLIVALAYRIITVLIAFVGVCYYLGSRQEVAEGIQAAEQDQSPPLDVLPMAPHNGAALRAGNQRLAGCGPVEK
jgi:uncharacterized protein (TIRG00374 family)